MYYKTIIPLKLHRTLTLQEADSQLKNLTSQDYQPSQYQGHLQVTKFQAFQD